MSTVKTLSQAAGLMLGRAEGAYGDTWTYDLTWKARTYEVRASDDFCLAEGIPGEGLGRWTAEHIASWGPAVVREVAKLLMAQIDYWVDGEGPCATPCTHADCEATNALLPLALAYLGEEVPSS